MLNHHHPHPRRGHSPPLTRTTARPLDHSYNVRTLLSKCWRRFRGTCSRRLGIAVSGKGKADVVFAAELEVVREYEPAPSMASSFSRDGDGGATLTQDYQLMEDGE